jgi:hypothetical protein
VPEFFQKPIGDLLGEKQRAIESEVAAIEPAVLLRTPRAALERALVDNYRLEPPEVAFDDKRQEQRRKQTTSPGMRGGPAIIRSSLEVMVHIPCSGDIGLLRFRPSRGYMTSFAADTDGSRSLVFKIQAPLADPELMKAQVEAELADRLRYWPEMVRNLRDQIEEFNDGLPSFVRSTVGYFVDQAERFAKVEELIDIPLLERHDPVAEAVSLTPKRITLPAPSPLEPNPQLEPGSYELLLERLRVIGQAIERVPEPFRDLDEEALRFLFLVILNSQFGLEGAATGETFNAEGKTDILVRWQNLNLFIGECKVWHGESTVADGIDQLFGYLTIREGRAALLLFVRNKEFTKTMAKALARAKQHECFEVSENAPPDEARLVFHLPQDSDKKVRVAVMGFNIRP